MGRAPTEEELAAHVKLDVEHLRRALADASLVLISLDAPNGSDDSLHESLPDPTTQLDPDEAVSEREMRRQLGEAIQSLPERERQVLSLYYFEELTMKEIGYVLQVSESRVSQLHAKAVLTLRVLMTAAAVEQDVVVTSRPTPALAAEMTA
ncbi:MAG: sigma-70 family RNA polymerase sigma factor [Candidatus Zixiibacteriota bacterium]